MKPKEFFKSILMSQNYGKVSGMYEAIEIIRKEHGVRLMCGDSREDWLDLILKINNRIEEMFHDDSE